MSFFFKSRISLLTAFVCVIIGGTDAQVADVSSSKFSMEINGHTLKIPVYFNHDIFTVDPSINKVVIVIQGSNRNAGPYLANMEIAGNNSSVSTANTAIVAPQFLIESDINFHSLDAEHLYWSNGGWKSGANSKDEVLNPRPERIPSYAVLDSLLLHLADQFPNLESIVFTGHSAGGQVTQRMAASSPIADILCSDYGITTRFVVINPSSYVYMDEQRKEAGSLSFSVPTTSCIVYNEWKYGLEDLYTYPGYSGVSAIRNMYKRRAVTYMIGEDDNNPNSSSLDTSCEALLQGSQRLERGEIYFNYMLHYYGNSITTYHDLVTVPNVGHSSLGMWNSVEGRYNIFEKPFLPCSTLLEVSDVDKSSEIAVYPNPTSDILNVSLTGLPDVVFQLQVFDLNGQLMLTQDIETEGEFRTSTLSSGMYILSIQSKANRFFKRFIVR